MEPYYEERKKSESKSEKTSNELLKELLKKRDQYLKENPHLIPFQEEIDRLMDNAGSRENRMAVLGIMLEGKLRELQKELTSLGDMFSSEKK